MVFPLPLRSPSFPAARPLKIYFESISFSSSPLAYCFHCSPDHHHLLPGLLHKPCYCLPSFLLCPSHCSQVEPLNPVTCGACSSAPGDSLCPSASKPRSYSDYETWSCNSCFSDGVLHCPSLLMPVLSHPGAFALAVSSAQNALLSDVCMSPSLPSS